MKYIDFHCHLDSSEFSLNRNEVIKRIYDAGVSIIVTVADPYEPDSHNITKKILSENKNIYSMTAAHPHNAANYSEEIEKKIFEFASEKKVIAIGEAGLDYHYNFSAPDIQKKVFARQLSIAKDLDLPIVIHSRNAETDVLKILKDEKFKNPVIFHCYTGNSDDAERIIEQGYYISFSGIVTFKKSGDLRRTVLKIPLNRIFTETDSPYLSPVPFRGKVNSPERVPYVAEKIAELKNIPVEELNREVRANFDRIFF